MNATNLRNWLNRGELEKLENVVLEGRGARLMGEFSPDLRTRIFLKGLPNFLMKITELHDAVVRGSLWEVKRLVESDPRKKLIYAKDPAGTPVIHKAVYYDHHNILDWIVMHFPDVVDLKDREGRTALHYCAACSDPEAVWDTLVDAGCDASVCDKRSNPAAFYLQRGTEIELPDLNRAMASRRNRDSTSRSLEIKPSNIRIWIHNRDIGKLQYVLWEGHGSKLRCETSNNVRVKKFLEAAPYIMVTIKDIHAAVIKNDIDGFKSKLEEPVSPVILCSKDSNGLNVLHKAAGLGYVDMAKEILERYPAIVNSTDNEGRTPLHYASVCRDGGIMYDLLVENGADESKVDNKHKNAAHYKSKPAEIDLSSLVIIPEAPRVSGTGYPKGWDWRIIDSDHPLRKRNHANNNSNNNLGDDDSAFGSAESAKLLDDTPETETAEDELNGNNEATDNNEEENPENEINAEENGETTSEDPPENAEDGAEEEPVNPENEEEKLEGEEEKPEEEAEETEKPGEEEENPENEVETADGEEEKLTITEITEEESEPKEEPENDEETIIDANNNETEFTEIEEHNPESDKKESDEDQEQDPADEDTGQEGDLIQLEPQEETEPDKETESADNNDANPELVNVPNEEEQVSAALDVTKCSEPEQDKSVIDVDSDQEKEIDLNVDTNVNVDGVVQEKNVVTVDDHDSVVQNVADINVNHDVVGKRVKSARSSKCNVQEDLKADGSESECVVPEKVVTEVNVDESVINSRVQSASQANETNIQQQTNALNDNEFMVQVEIEGTEDLNDNANQERISSATKVNGQDMLEEPSLEIHEIKSASVQERVSSAKGEIATDNSMVSKNNENTAENHCESHERVPSARPCSGTAIEVTPNVDENNQINEKRVKSAKRSGSGRIKSASRNNSSVVALEADNVDDKAECKAKVKSAKRTTKNDTAEKSEDFIKLNDDVIQDRVKSASDDNCIQDAIVNEVELTNDGVDERVKSAKGITNPDLQDFSGIQNEIHSDNVQERIKSASKDTVEGNQKQSYDQVEENISQEENLIDLNVNGNQRNKSAAKVKREIVESENNCVSPNENESDVQERVKSAINDHIDQDEHSDSIIANDSGVKGRIKSAANNNNSDGINHPEQAEGKIDN